MPRIIDLGPPYGPTSFADDASDADIVAQYDSLEAERARSLKRAKMVGVRLADLAEEQKPTWGKVALRSGIAFSENVYGTTKQAVGGLARNIGQLGDIPLLEEAGKDITDEGDKQIREAAELGQQLGGGVLASSAESLAGSFGGSVPMLIAGPLGRTAMAAATAVQTFGPTQSQFRDRLMQLNPDLTEQEAFDQARLPAGLNAVASGLLTRAFGGVEKYIGRIAEEGLSRVAATSLLRDAWKGALGEFPEEYGQQLAQGLFEKAFIDRNKPIGEIFNEAGMAGLTGAVLGAGTVSGIGGVLRGADAISGKIEGAVEESRVRRQSTRESRERISKAIAARDAAATRGSTATPPPLPPATPTAPAAPPAPAPVWDDSPWVSGDSDLPPGLLPRDADRFRVAFEAARQQGRRQHVENAERLGLSIPAGWAETKDVGTGTRFWEPRQATPAPGAQGEPLEQMTPDEFDARKAAGDAVWLKIKQDRARARGEDWSKIVVATSNERGVLVDAIKNGRPVNAALFERYNKSSERPIYLPADWEQRGAMWHPPSKPATPAAEAPAPEVDKAKVILLRQEGLSEAQARNVLLGKMTPEEAAQEVISAFEQRTADSVDRPVPTMEHMEAVSLAREEAINRINDIVSPAPADIRTPKAMTDAGKTGPRFKSELESMSDNEIVKWWNGLSAPEQRNALANGAGEFVTRAKTNIKAKTATPTPTTPAPAATGATAQKQPWEMTRWDYAEFAKPNKVPPEFDALDALAKRSNRSPYNPDAITEKSMQEFKANGWVSGTKNFKLTEAGRNKLDGWRRDARENDLAAGDASDNHIELVEKALREGKPVPPEVLADYAGLLPAPPAKPGAQPYSKEAIQSAFNLTPEQAEAVDALVKALGLDESRIKVADGGSASERALLQMEDILIGEEKVPQFDRIAEVVKFIRKYASQNTVIPKGIQLASIKGQAAAVDAIVEHTILELAAWKKISKNYIPFYTADILERTNPALQRHALEKYGRKLSAAEIAFVHLLSAFGSGQAEPTADTITGMRVFDEYMRTGRATGYTDKPKPVFRAPARGEPTVRVFVDAKTGEDTIVAKGNKPKFDATQKAQISKTYNVSGLARFNRVLDHFAGDLDKTIEWLGAQHTFEDIQSVIGAEAAATLKPHEYLNKSGLTFGTFTLGNNPKLGSYILNRWQKLGTITKDMWVARTMSRYFREPNTGKPWVTTVEGNIKRRILDEAWGIVAKRLGVEPAQIQEMMWDAEKQIYARFGQGSLGAYTSQGVEMEIARLNQDGTGAEPKGAVDFIDDGNSVLRGFSAADVSTGLHEFAHVARRQLLDRSVPAEQRLGISDKDIAAAEAWAGAKDGVWDRPAEEKFARGFERYLRDGKSPTPQLASIFAKFKEWLVVVYRKLAGSGIDVKISPEMRGVFDRLVTRSERLKQPTNPPAETGAKGKQLNLRLLSDPERTARISAWRFVPGGGDPESLGTGFISGKHNEDIATRAGERGDIGLLITPLIPGYLKHANKYPFVAIDNGVFSKKTPFSEVKFRKLLDQVSGDKAVKPKVLFVVAPDVVGDAAATLDRFTPWSNEIRAKGLPVALAAQDGLESMMDKIPWDLVDVLFVGGSTEWKTGQMAPKQRKQWLSLFGEAHLRGIPIHMGRANTNERISGVAQEIGAGSVDGTLLAFGPTKNLVRLEKILDNLNVKGLNLAAQNFPELGRAPTDQELYEIAIDPDVTSLDDLGAYAPAASKIKAMRVAAGIATSLEESPPPSTDIQESKVSPANDKIVAAAVRVGDQIFTGTSHADAASKAVESGALVQNGDIFTTPDGNRLPDGSFDWFQTQSGKLIPRNVAYKTYGSKAVDQIRADSTQESKTPVISGSLPAQSVAQHLADTHGVQPGGIVQVVTDPSANFDGRIIFDKDTGKLVRIEINSAKVTSTQQVDSAIDHEIGHAVWREGGVNAILATLSEADRAAIDADVTRLGYSPENSKEESGARGIAELAKAWSTRGWFQQIVGRVLAWANSHGFRLTRLAAELIAARAIANTKARVTQSQGSQTTQNPDVQQSVTEPVPPIQAEQVAGGVAQVGRIAEEIYAQRELSAQELEGLAYERKQYKAARTELKRLANIAYGRFGASAQLAPGAMVPDFSKGVSINDESGEIEVDSTFTDALESVNVPHNPSVVQHMQAELFFEGAARRLNNILAQIETLKSAKDHYVLLNAAPNEISIIDKSINKLQTQASKLDDATNGGGDTVGGRASEMRANAEMRPARMAQRDSLALEPVAEFFGKNVGKYRSFVERAESARALTEVLLDAATDPAEITRLTADVSSWANLPADIRTAIKFGHPLTEEQRLTVFAALSQVFGEFDIVRARMNEIRAARLPVIAKEEKELIKQAREFSIKSGTEEVMIYDVLATLDGETGGTGSIQGQAIAQQLKQQASAIQTFALNLGNSLETNWSLFEWLANPTISGGPAMFSVQGFNIDSQTLAMILDEVKRNPAFGSAIVSLVASSQKKLKNMPVVQLEVLEKLVAEGKVEEAQALSNKLMERANANASVAESALHETLRKLDALNIERMSLDSGAAMFTELEESPEFRETRDLVANSAYGHLMEMVLQNNTTTTFLPFGTKEMGEGKWDKGFEMDASASPVLQSGWHQRAIAYYQNAQRYLDAYGEAEKQHLEDPSKPQPSDLGFDLAKVRGLRDATERMMRGMFMEVSLMSENKRWKVPRLNRWLSERAWFRQHDQVTQMVGGQPGTELRIKLGDFINHHLIGKSIDQRFSDLPILRNKAMKSHPEVQMNFANYREIWNEMSHWGRLRGTPVRAGFPLLISGTVVTAEDVALLKREVQYEEELRRKVTETNTVSGVRYKLGDREYVRPGAYVGDEGLPRHLGLQSNTFIADILAAYGDGRTPIAPSTDLSASSTDPMVAFWNKNLKDLKQHVLDVRREDRAMVIDPVMDRAEKNTEADWRLNGTPTIQSVEDLVNALVAHAPAMTGVNVRDRIIAGLNTELRQYRDAAKRIENDRAERDKSRNTGASIALSADNEFTKPAAKLELPSRYYNYGALTDSEHLTASSRANHERVVAYAVAVNRAIANLQGRVSRYEAPGTGISASEAASSYGGDIEEMKQVLGLLKLIAADFEAAYGMGSANATKKGFFSDLFGMITSAVLAGPTVGIRNMSSGQLEVFALSRAMGLGGYRMTMGLAMKNAVRALSRFSLSAADWLAKNTDLGIALSTGTDKKVFTKLVDWMAILLMQPDYRASAARVHELGYDTRDSIISRYQRIWQETEESANREELDASKISILGQERQLSKLAGLPVKLLRATFDKVGVQQYDQALNSSLLGYAHLLERRLKEVAINYGEAREAEGLGEFNLADKRWTLKPHEWAAFKGIQIKGNQQNEDSLARFRILLESSAAAEGFQLEQNLWDYYQRIKKGESPAMFTGPQFDSIQRKLVADFNASTPANRSSASAGNPWVRNILTLQGYGSDLLLKLINSTGGVRDRAAAASLLTKIPILSSLAVMAVALGYMALSATGEWDRRLRGKMPTLPTPLDKDFWTSFKRWREGTLRMGAAQIPYIGDLILLFMGQTQGNKGFDPIGRIWPVSVAQGLLSAVTGSWKTYKGAGSLTDSVKPMLDFGRKIGPYWLEIENAFGEAQGAVKQSERVGRGEMSNLNLLPESRGGAGVSYGPTTIVRRNLGEAVSDYYKSTQSGDAEGAASALVAAKAEMAKLEAFYTKKYIDAGDAPEKAKEKAVRDVWNDYQEINPVVSGMLGKRPTQAQFDLIRSGITGERRAVFDAGINAWQAGAQALFNRPGSITREDVSGNRAGLGSAGTGLPTLPKVPGSTVRRSSSSGYLRTQGGAPSIPQGSAYRPSRRRMRSTISRRRSVRRVSRKMPKITRKRPTLGSRVRRSYASA
jgi:hypothetical protein